jgi:hypothetical protein
MKWAEEPRKATKRASTNDKKVMRERERERERETAPPGTDDGSDDPPDVISHSKPCCT